MERQTIYEVEYEPIALIGKGTYGDVIKGFEKSSKNNVAMKKIKINLNEGFPLSVLREIQILREVHHDNIVRFKNVSKSTNMIDVFLIFEYCEYDLEFLIHGTKSIYFELNQIQCFLKQLLVGLQFCHDNKIVHRDLKPANLLVTTNNKLKIADFGLAFSITREKRKPSTDQVITIWYRPPELLLGAKEYGSEIDIWSVGCILYEMITKEVLFQTGLQSEIEQMRIVCSICGEINDEVFPNFQTLPNAPLFHFKTPVQSCGLPQFLKSHIKPQMIDLGAADLIQQMLDFNPKKRITAKDALTHPFVSNIDPSELSPINYPESHQKFLGTSKIKDFFINI